MAVCDWRREKQTLSIIFIKKGGGTSVRVRAFLVENMFDKKLEVITNQLDQSECFSFLSPK
jgi:hypothetical protein